MSTEERLADETVAELQRAQEFKGKAQELHQKEQSLSDQLGEHERVLDTLKNMQDDRTCMRMVGHILVRRRVDEVRAELKENASRITQALEKIVQQKKAFDDQADQILGKHGDVLEELGKRRALEQAERV